MKSSWKAKVKYNVHLYEERAWRERMRSDCDFNRFILVHDNLFPHTFWRLSPESDKLDLCHRCGKMYNDIYTHIVLQCGFTEEVRYRLWCEFLSIDEIGFNVYLHSHSDFQLFHILIGGKIMYDLNRIDIIEFRHVSVRYVSKMLNDFFK